MKRIALLIALALSAGCSDIASPLEETTRLASIEIATQKAVEDFGRIQNPTDEQRKVHAAKLDRLQARYQEQVDRMQHSVKRKAVNDEVARRNAN